MTPDQALSRLPVSTQIARALAERIVTGILPPDSPLRQNHVAAEFNVSHVPVREALRELESTGLVVSEPRRGVRVAPLDAQDVLAVALMRAELEALALRCGHEAMTADRLAEARALLDLEDEAASKGELIGWEEANRKFHQLLITGCGIPRLLQAIADLQSASRRHLFASWRQLDWTARSSAEHRRMLDMIAAGDAEGASRMLAQHIREAGIALSQALRAGPEAG